jgi:hypothetical protein
MAPRSLDQWEETLSQVLNRIDDLLEDRFGKTYSLKPTRPPRGTTANRRYDGLFAVEAKFSLGLGRKEGAGYSVDVRMATFEEVPDDVERQIHAMVGEVLREEIPKAFPGRELTVTDLDDYYVIHGNLGWD